MHVKISLTNKMFYSMDTPVFYFCPTQGPGIFLITSMSERLSVSAKLWSKICLYHDNFFFKTLSFLKTLNYFPMKSWINTYKGEFNLISFIIQLQLVFTTNALSYCIICMSDTLSDRRDRTFKTESFPILWPQNFQKSSLNATKKHLCC